MNNLPHDRMEKAVVAREARSIIRRATTAALGTLDAGDGGPHVSLVTVGTDIDCAPVLLLSGLARQTKNIKADSRASLLFSRDAGGANPAGKARVTVSGHLAATDEKTAGQRYLDRYPEARGYAGFSDFAFYRMTVTCAQFTSGLGQVERLRAEELLIDADQARRFANAQASILEHMNSDHADVLGLWATRMLKQKDGDWTIIGCDPEGFDISLDGLVERLEFAEPLGEPAGARSAFATLAREVRNT